MLFDMMIRVNLQEFQTNYRDLPLVLLVDD